MSVGGTGLGGPVGHEILPNSSAALGVMKATKSEMRLLDPRHGCGLLRRIADTHGTFIVKGIPEAAPYLQNLNFRAKTRGKACRLFRMEGFAVHRENH